MELRLFTYLLSTLSHTEESFYCSPTAQRFGNSSRLTQSWWPAAISTLLLLQHVMVYAISLGMCPFPGLCLLNGHRSSLLWDSPNLYAVPEVEFKSNLTLLFFFKFFFNVYLFLGQREGVLELEVASNTGLEPMNCEIMTWAKVGDLNRVSHPDASNLIIFKRPICHCGRVPSLKKEKQTNKTTQNTSRQPCYSLTWQYPSWPCNMRPLNQRTCLCVTIYGRQRSQKCIKYYVTWHSGLSSLGRNPSEWCQQE